MIGFMGDEPLAKRFGRKVHEADEPKKDTIAFKDRSKQLAENGYDIKSFTSYEDMQDRSYELVEGKRKPSVIHRPENRHGYDNILVIKKDPEITLAKAKDLVELERLKAENPRDAVAIAKSYGIPISEYDLPEYEKARSAQDRGDSSPEITALLAEMQLPAAERASAARERAESRQEKLLLEKKRYATRDTGGGFQR